MDPNGPTEPPPPASPPPVLPPAPSAGPLTPEHLAALAQAELRAKKVRKAGGVAMFNGCTIAFFGGLSLLIGAIELLLREWDYLALVMGVGLSVIAWNEFRGRALLRRFDRRAPRVLGWNQVGLMALLIGYCAWQIIWALIGPNPYAEAVRSEPMLGSMLGDIGELYKKMTIVVYGAVIVATLIFQGLNALYYFSRAKLLRAYLDETPPWVVEVQRCSAAGQ